MGILQQSFFDFSIMYSKLKKQQDPLTLLQRDLNQIGLAVHIKAKKAKKKGKRKQQQQNNDNIEYAPVKFPSLYKQGSLSKQNYCDGKSILLQRIQQFQNRINDLQTQNAIQKKQNQRLIDHVAKLRTNHRSVYQNSRPREVNQSYNQTPPYYAPQYSPYPQPPFMQQMPFQMPLQNLYQMGNMGNMNDMNPYSQPSKNKAGKKIKKLDPIRRFRVAGYVVYFSIFFKKYSKSFTINRFDDFKDNWSEKQYVMDGKQKLIQYFRQYIPLDIFQRQDVSDLDELKNVGEQENQQKLEKKTNKNNKNQKKKKKIDVSDSSSSSDESGSQSSKSSDSSISNKKNKNKNNKNKNSKDDQNQEEEQKIDVAVAFVVQFIKQISKSLENQQFSQNANFLILFMSRQFQPDRLHDQSDFKYLNQHSQKGYSQNEKTVTEYFLVKNVILDIFVNSLLLNQFGRRFFIQQKNKYNEADQNRVFFSFFIRTTIFKKMVEQYLQKKIQNVKSSNLPKQQLRPFPKYLKSEDPFKDRSVVFENNGISMDQENIQGISQSQIRKKEKQLKGVLDESCQKMWKKIIQFRKKMYQQLKEKTLSQKYRTQDNKYFKLHEKGELAKEKEKLKTSNSLFKKTSISQFDQFEDGLNQVSETSMMNKKIQKKTNNKSNNNVKKKTNANKKKPVKQQTSSEDSSN